MGEQDEFVVIKGKRRPGKISGIGNISLFPSSSFDTLLPNCFKKEKKEYTPKCNVCGSTASKRCSNCHLVWYCDPHCQKIDYKKHTKLCNMILVINDFPCIKNDLTKKTKKEIIPSCCHCQSQENVSQVNRLQPHCFHCLVIRGSHESPGHSMYTPCIDCIPKGMYVAGK